MFKHYFISKILVSFLAVFIFFTACPVLTAQDNRFEDEYKTALSYFNQRQNDKAIILFQEILDKSRNHSLADNCQYWLGECYYSKALYQKAIVEFEKVFTYTVSNKEDDAQLKLGLCYMRLQDRENAKRELTRLISRYPNSEFVDLARRLLKDL